MKSILSQETINSLEQMDYLEDILKTVYSGIDKGLYTEEEMKNDLEAVLWLSYAYINYDTYPAYLKAERLLKRVEQQGEKKGVWCYRYASSLLFLKKYDLALKYCKQAVENDPEYPWGWLLLAKMYYKFNEKEKAFEAIEAGLKLVPDDYEFTTLKKEIEAGESFAKIINHYIDEEYDKSREDEDRLERLEKEIAEYRKRYEGKSKQKC